MVYFENQSALKLENLRLDEIFQGVCKSIIGKGEINQNVEVYVLSDEEMIELNTQFRGQNKLTDVLSFPTEAVVPNLPLGSIVMSASLIESKAREFGHSNEEELKLLFIHGLLHLFGFDHEVDSGEHRAKEIEMIEHFGLPKSLIVRA